MLPIATCKRNPQISMPLDVWNYLITLLKEKQTYNQFWILTLMSWDNGVSCMFLLKILELIALLAIYTSWFRGSFNVVEA
jgi:hypothetical protein